MAREKRRPKKPSSKIDYRKGVPGVEKPVCFQPRAGGPPLLFLTDVRMTILVTLALANGPIRQKNLWAHLGKSPKTALYPLVKLGLVSMWNLGRMNVYVALDPCHPAAEPLRRLLLTVAENYSGFSKPKYSLDDRDGGDAPVRPRRLRDVRNTFGDPQRTLPLLLVHIRRELVGIDVTRIVSYVPHDTARDILWMYHAFGLLSVRKILKTKKRGYVFSFDEANPLVPHIHAVLTALDEAMPQWRIREERQKHEPVPKRPDSHRGRSGRRKPNRWKW